MFVQVEVQPGEWCIGLLPVSIKEQVAQVEFFKAECLAVRMNGTERECEMDFTDLLQKTVWVPEYRICDFTFGGVMMTNPKFDPIRIDQEDEAWLLANLPATGQSGSTGPQITGSGPNTP
jgi:hypothetical protein